MYIIRNDKRIELTKDEIKAAAEKFSSDISLEEFTDTLVQSLRTGEIDDTIIMNQGLLEKMYSRFQEKKRNNSSYWDYVWNLVKQSIKEVAEEECFHFSDLLYLKNACLMYERLEGPEALRLLTKKYLIGAENPKTLAEVGRQTRLLTNFILEKVKMKLPEETYDSWFDDSTLYTDEYYHRKYPNEIPNPKLVKHFLYFSCNILKVDQAGCFELALYDFNDYGLYFNTEEQVNQFIKKYDVAPATLYKLIDADENSPHYGDNICEEVWCI